MTCLMRHFEADQNAQLHFISLRFLPDEKNWLIVSD
jgi:hypothetical protein